MEHVKYQQPTRLLHSCSCSYYSAAPKSHWDRDPEIHAAQRDRFACTAASTRKYRFATVHSVSSETIRTVQLFP